jgi:hypothetical protein
MANLVNKSTSKAKRTFLRVFSKPPRNTSPFASEAIERSDGEEDRVKGDSPLSAPEHVKRMSASTAGTPGQPPDIHITPESVSDEPPPTPSPGRQPRAEGGFPWLNSVKLALELFEKTLNSVPAPGLRGVIGGVLKIIERYDVSNFVYSV